ncbi:conserved hypothetical protein [Pyrenophora tritici-repentis Pt-1C-BFP]|uniref:Ferric reductase NAD binding domain-containing protein n=1 Tax=Pyrenophora tritici-repentis (strain Pt-1C-BFP) TaxID=426418 RepID=B2W5J8_PYRTR|nr:uncharacterized protein PTRG_04898 [Pyrenophora tritici-repentis Pt-1C-BFP]EDU47805.1 conserved hypothetical protein [Pyrenophora tritici-repentis Pt-1C-BFP]
MVASSDSEGHDFQLRIQPRTGFTNRLLTRSLVGVTQLSALVEGPYGHGFDLRDFGTVVLFASGIGIVGHLAYIQELVHDYRQSKTKTRDLLLVWHVDNKYQLDLVWEVMNNILRRDDLPGTAIRQDTRTPSGNEKIDRHLGGSSTNESPGIRPAPHGENIIDVYIYGNYEILDETGHAVPYKRAGSRIAEVEGKPDYAHTGK